MAMKYSNKSWGITRHSTTFLRDNRQLPQNGSKLLVGKQPEEFLRSPPHSAKVNLSQSDVDQVLGQSWSESAGRRA